eukprot:1554389-Pleurochrysis_carterae.AAC.2
MNFQVTRAKTANGLFKSRSRAVGSEAMQLGREAVPTCGLDDKSCSLSPSGWSCSKTMIFDSLLRRASRNYEDQQGPLLSAFSLPRFGSIITGGTTCGSHQDGAPRRSGYWLLIYGGTAICYGA